ncbi:MAG: hypothetical protein ACI9NN_002003, partial [Bacteroidia bacterium]
MINDVVSTRRSGNGGTWHLQLKREETHSLSGMSNDVVLTRRFGNGGTLYLQLKQE